ncbi:MAG: hypothetical protein V3U17_04455 [Thermoplasmata archaeon]
MSRGGWIMIIAGILLLVGIALFAFGTAGFLAGFSPTSNSITVNGYENRTVQAEVGVVLGYLVAIENFAAGDEVSVFIQPPGGGAVNSATVNSASPLSAQYVATDTGAHVLVIQNTGSRTVTVLSAMNTLDPASTLLGGAGFLLGIVGFILFIVGLILWIIDRGRARRRPTEMPPAPPSMPPPR